MALLGVCSVMVVRQALDRDQRRLEMRENLIVLQEEGKTKQAEYYYQRLVQRLDELPERSLIDDYHRTLLLVDPEEKQRYNLVWKYHWAVRNEMQRRAQQRLNDLEAPTGQGN